MGEDRVYKRGCSADSGIVRRRNVRSNVVGVLDVEPTHRRQQLGQGHARAVRVQKVRQVPFSSDEQLERGSFAERADEVVKATGVELLWLCVGHKAACIP